MNSTSGIFCRAGIAAAILLALSASGAESPGAAVAARPDDDAYMVVDLSGGADADRYPVAYLSAPPAGGWTDEYKTTKLVLRLVPAGTFTMGSPSDERGRLPGLPDETQHEVTISQPFYIGVFPVTQRQYELVTAARPGYFSNADCYQTRPVENVSWDDIRGAGAAYNWPRSAAVDPAKFMGRLRAKTRLSTFDLPTEAKWEYACRAGTTTALNSGKNLASTVQTSRDANMDEVGRYLYNYPSGTTDYPSGDSGVTNGSAAVGSYLPNAWGLYDMHGNVCEWCLDYRGDYPTTAVTDPVGPDSGMIRVIRGGSWYSNAWYCRSAARDTLGPANRRGFIGFRLVCSVPRLTTAANGRLSVADCFEVGVDPDDPDDDLRITAFWMEGDKPVITVNHTEDSDGNPLQPRLKTLGKAKLSDGWERVPDEGSPVFRFFTVMLERP